MDRALEELAGPFGLRRFLVHFKRQGEAAVVTGIEAIPLSWGGGPPPEDQTGRHFDALEKALCRLQRNMAVGAERWDRGAVGYVRDREGRSRLFPVFDEEAAIASVDLLPVPKPGHPLESPEWMKLLAQWGPRMETVQAQTRVQHHDWEEWAVHDSTWLELANGLSGDGAVRDLRRLRCQALATFDARWKRFQWVVDKPITKGLVFESQHFPASYDAAMEVGLLATALIGGRWLFMGATDEAGSVLMAAVLD